MTSSILTSNGARALLMVAMTKAYSAYDTKMKKYRHMNFFEHECHLHVRTPRIKRDDSKVRLILPPWAGQLNVLAPCLRLLLSSFVSTCRYTMFASLWMKLPRPKGPDYITLFVDLYKKAIKRLLTLSRF